MDRLDAMDGMDAADGVCRVDSGGPGVKGCRLAALGMLVGGLLLIGHRLYR